MLACRLAVSGPGVVGTGDGDRFAGCVMGRVPGWLLPVGRLTPMTLERPPGIGVVLGWLMGVTPVAEGQRREMTSTRVSSGPGSPNLSGTRGQGGGAPWWLCQHLVWWNTQNLGFFRLCRVQGTACSRQGRCAQWAGRGKHACRCMCVGVWTPRVCPCVCCKGGCSWGGLVLHDQAVGRSPQLAPVPPHLSQELCWMMTLLTASSIWYGRGMFSYSSATTSLIATLCVHSVAWHGMAWHGTVCQRRQARQTPCKQQHC